MAQWTPLSFSATQYVCARDYQAERNLDIHGKHAWALSSLPRAPVVFLQAAQQSDAGAFSRSPGWVSVALTSQPSP